MVYIEESFQASTNPETAERFLGSFFSEMCILDTMKQGGI